MLTRCVTGNFINFAVCDFYNDNSFATLSALVFRCIMNQDIRDLRQYEKI